MIARVRHAVAIGAVLVLASAACGRAEATSQIRTVHVVIHHSRFLPGSIDVAPGETIRFVVENDDPIDHEFLVGDEIIQRIHDVGTEAHHPPKPGEMSIPALATRVTMYAFPLEEGSMIFGCHLPGHYAYGMKGPITIR
jgi:uncharacterized cupredoxin-like copper-binding protein